MQHIYILGSGAMGCLWASYFNHNASLHFITRDEQPNHFQFEVLPEHKTIKASTTTAQAINSQHQKIKYLIVCTKAFDALNAVNSIKEALSPDCQIILIQNGMGSQQAIAASYPGLAIYACSSTEGVYKENPNLLIHAGQGENHIGPLTPCAKQDKLQSYFPDKHYQWHNDVNPILWKKLIINSAINPLTVIYQCKNGELLNQPQAYSHMVKICQELDQLSERLGLNLGPSLELATAVCVTTANNFSSMYQDHKSDRPTEIEYITGYIIKRCDELGIECPENRKLSLDIAAQVLAK